MTINNQTVLVGSTSRAEKSGEYEELSPGILRFTDATSDLELLSAIRDHDPRAYAELYRRHVDAARAAAYRIAPDLGVDDLVAESFTRIIQATQRGKGPTEAFKPYLYSVIRSVVAETLRKPAPVLGDMDEIPDTKTPLDRETQQFEHVALARAFAKLPERWQRVLWHTEVEGLPPREVAKILGDHPRTISQLVFRARKGLREAWIFEHIDTTNLPLDCQNTVKRLDKFSRNEMTEKKTEEVKRHLAGCRSCRSSLEELNYVSSHMGRGLSAVVLLGGGLGVVVTSNALTPSAALASSATSVSAASVSGSSVLGKVLVGAALFAGATALPVGLMMDTAQGAPEPNATQVTQTKSAEPVVEATPVKNVPEQETPVAEEAAPVAAPVAEPIALPEPADDPADEPVQPSSDGGDPPSNNPESPAPETREDDTWTPPSYPTVVRPADEIDSSSPDTLE